MSPMQQPQRDADQTLGPRDPEDRKVAPGDTAHMRGKNLDKTIADSFPTSVRRLVSPIPAAKNNPLLFKNISLMGGSSSQRPPHCAPFSPSPLTLLGDSYHLNLSPFPVVSRA